MPQIKVNLQNRSYPIIIGSDLNDKLIKQLKKFVKNNRLFVFYDSQFYVLHGQNLAKALKKEFKTSELVIPSGEKTKSVTEINKIHNYLLSENISRTDFILACGGGVTSDLIGYTAATVLRGVRWGIISSTLLGMVDAAIGGKTGINHKTGKNLIGAFWQPSVVSCDSNFLMTLPKREMICGLGEIVKYAGLMGIEMVKQLETYLSKNDLYHQQSLNKLIKLSVQYKADIVAKDELDSGKRMFLNFGHTIGHAIENSIGYGKILHGEAVLLGLYAVVESSLMQFKQAEKSLRNYQKIIERFIPNVPIYKINSDLILNAMKSDKKRIDAKQKYILLKSLGNPIIIDSIEKKKLKKAITRMLDIYYSNGTGYA